jgi:hypothetical protein
MQVFCPRCASAAPQGQRFCKNCGLKLDLIVDAMEGRQLQITPEVLKEGLLKLGDSLRTGYENYKQEAKETRRLTKEAKHRKHNLSWIEDTARWGADVGTEIGLSVGDSVMNAFHSGEETRADRKLKQALAKKLPATRKYSLQQGILQIMGGGISAGIWYAILHRMWLSGFLDSVVQAIGNKTEIPTNGLASVLQLLWLFALIPVATGIGHLINGIFFAAKPEDLRLDLYAPPAAQPTAIPPVPTPVSAVPTNELERDLNAPISVTEEETRRFVEREA